MDKTPFERLHSTNKSIEVGEVYLVRRPDGTVHLARIIQERIDPNYKCTDYYIHYVGQNRRLDQWVESSAIIHPSQFDENSDGKFIKPEPCDTSIFGESVEFTFHQNQPTVASTTVGDRKITRNQKRRHDEYNQKTYGEKELTSDAVEKEHEAITKVKYIDKLRFSRFEIDTWYFSPYPMEYGKLSTLYVCEYCMIYMKLQSTFWYHQTACKQRQPPGKEIYRKDGISVFEVDSIDHKFYCQSLCLMAKLFLDHKTLYYDVGGFYFYVMCEIDKSGCHIVGYFSKEKESPDGNNVACILILPPFQRKGYGKFLIAFSYALSCREGVCGSPEKPLSDLGRLSYRSYWAYTLLELMKKCQSETLSINELSLASGFTHDDIVYTLQSMMLVKFWKGMHVICVSPKTVEQQLHLPQFRRPQLMVDLKCLKWMPPKKIQLATNQQLPV